MKFMTIDEIPGRVPPLHYDLLGRVVADESQGVMRFVSKVGEQPLRQGQAVLVLRGEVHSNYNIADDTTEYITVTATS